MVKRNELHAWLPRDKHDLDRAATLISKGYPAVEPVIPEMLEWMQDGNWPVAKIIGPFLASIGISLTDDVRNILHTQDHIWKYWILSQVVSDSPALAKGLYRELTKIVEAPAASDEEEEVKEVATEILRWMEWSEQLAGIVASVEVYAPEMPPLRSGVILRPEEEWRVSITVGYDVKIVLSGGEAYKTRVLGFTLSENPTGALVKEIPGVPNESLVGAQLIVLE